MISTKHFFVLLFLLSLLPGKSGMVSGQAFGQPKSFMPAPGYQFTASTSGALVWAEGINQNFSLSLTLDDVPDTISRIQFDSFFFQSVATINNIDTGVDLVTQVIDDFILTSENDTIEFDQVLSPPDTEDRFYLNITMFARTLGNVTQGEAQSYSLRFPDSGKIRVSRDALAPLVDLHGFPPSSFFIKWLPIFFGFIAIMVLPAIVALVANISDARRKKSFDVIDPTNEEVNPNE